MLVFVHAAVAQTRAVHVLASRWQEGDADLLLLDAGFGRALDVGPDLRDVAGFCELGCGDGDGLDEEFVAAAGVGGGIFFHCLEEDLDFDATGGVDAAGVGADAVSGTCVSGVCLVGFGG